VKPVSKTKVFEKLIVDQLLRLIMAFYGAHKCHFLGHKTPLHDSAPKFRLDTNLPVISSKWRAFSNPLFYVWVFLDQVRKDTAF
jgi:hypothetical protein